jgi:hypothetical protein
MGTTQRQKSSSMMCGRSRYIHQQKNIEKSVYIAFGMLKINIWNSVGAVLDVCACVFARGIWMPECTKRRTLAMMTISFSAPISAIGF